MIGLGKYELIEYKWHKTITQMNMRTAERKPMQNIGGATTKHRTSALGSGSL